MKLEEVLIFKVFKKGTRMKSIVLVFSIIVCLVLGFPEYYGLASEESLDSSSAEWHLDNLNLLVYDLLVDLSPTKEEMLRGATVDPDSSEDVATTGKISGSAETYHATIYSYEGEGIPSSLVDSFDRIFRMVAEYLNLGQISDRVVVWVMDLETLRKIPSGPQSAASGTPRNLVALYVSIFDYLLFTPEYMNDYYMTHELLHYYIDEYEEEVAVGLPPVIKQQNRANLSLQSFLKHNEEKIVVQLSKIIVRSGEHSFLYGKK